MKDESKNSKQKIKISYTNESISRT